METVIGDYIGPTIGIHSPIPYSAPDRLSCSVAPALGEICFLDPLRLGVKVWVSRCARSK